MKKRPAFPWKAGRPYKWSLWKRLAKPTRSCYDRFENKNAAAYGCWRTRKPAQVRTHLYNGNQPYPQGILYDISLLLARAPLPYLLPCFFILYGGICFSHCAGLLCAVFLFLPGTQGRKPLGVGIYAIRKNYTHYSTGSVSDVCL